MSLHVIFCGMSSECWCFRFEHSRKDFEECASCSEEAKIAGKSARCSSPYQRAPRACDCQQAIDVRMFSRISVGRQIAQACVKRKSTPQEEHNMIAEDISRTYWCESSRCSAYRAMPTCAACLVIPPDRHVMHGWMQLLASGSQKTRHLRSF